MDIESVRHTLEQANLVSIGVGFLLGFVFTFSNRSAKSKYTLWG